MDFQFQNGEFIVAYVGCTVGVIFVLAKIYFNRFLNGMHSRRKQRLLFSNCLYLARDVLRIVDRFTVATISKIVNTNLCSKAKQRSRRQITTCIEMKRTLICQLPQRVGKSVADQVLW